VKRAVIITVLLGFVLAAAGVAGMRYSKVFAQAAASDAKFVGADKCKGCHAKQYADYEARKFTKAWAVLQMRGKTKDPECLKCHCTGYGKPGGFVNEETTSHMKYKQCESCHGPGSAHCNNPMDDSLRQVMKSYVTEKNVCIDCHKCMRTHREADF